MSDVIAYIILNKSRFGCVGLSRKFQRHYFTLYNNWQNRPIISISAERRTLILNSNVHFHRLSKRSLQIVGSALKAYESVHNCQVGLFSSMYREI